MGFGGSALEAGDRRARFALLRDSMAAKGLTLDMSAPASLPTRLDDLDALLPGGFPRGGVVEILGSRASGKSSLAAGAVAAATREKRLAAWIDLAGESYPPALALLGIDLSRLLFVRPADFQGTLWAAEVLLQSAAFDVVVLDVPPGERSLPALSRLAVLRSSAESTRSALLVLGDTPLFLGGMPPAIRLVVAPSRTEGRFAITVERNRYGRLGTYEVGH